MRTLGGILMTGLLALALGGIGCGGGGSGDDPGGGDPGGGDPVTRNDLLEGDYHYLQLQGSPSSADMRAETGHCRADGEGALAFETAWSAAEGLVEGPFVPPSRTYTVSEDRHAKVVDTLDLSVEGRIAEDGSLAALCTQTPGELPAFLLLARRLTTPTLTELADDWFLIGWYRVPIPGQYTGAATGQVTINAAGIPNYTSYTYVVDGIVDPVPIPQPQQDIVVGSDGWLHWRVYPGANVAMRGGMSEDKNLMLFAGDFAGTKHAVIRVLVRAGTTTGTSQVAGAYHSAGIGTSATWTFTTWGLATFNGNGVGTYTIRTIRGGQVIHLDEYPNVTYGVGPNGGTGLQVLTVIPYLGATGSSGRYIVLSGPFASSGAPWFQVLMP